MSHAGQSLVLLVLGSVNFNLPRISAAHAFAVTHQNTDVMYVLSGGVSVLQDSSVESTGATEMARYLQGWGVLSSSLFLETDSTTTVQNVLNTAHLFPKQLEHERLVVFCGPEQIGVVRKLLGLLRGADAAYVATERRGSWLMRLRYWWTMRPSSVDDIVRRDDCIVRAAKLCAKSPVVTRLLRI